MNAIEKWNKIVALHEQYYRSSESTVQNVWENVFAELFGYSRLEGEVERHRPIQMGSTERVIPDIIIKNQDGDLFVVELKQHNAPFSIGMESQLFSYLKQLRDTIGVLVCDKLYVYSYDYGKKDDEQIRVEIPFVENNADGVQFVELFGKKDFNSKNVKAFVFEKNRFDLHVKAISKQITASLIVELIKDRFTPKYTESEVRAALGGFSITVNGKGLRDAVAASVVTQPITNVPVKPNNADHAIRKSEAVAALQQASVPIPKQCTFASLNKNGRYYWANPDVSVLTSDWWIILNDGRKGELHCFMVPCNTFAESQFWVRKDRNALDFEVKYGDDAFIDSRSKISFAPWLIKTIKY